MKMKKPMSKTKDSVRVRRERNLVAKHNKLKGGYHTSKKYERPQNSDWVTEL